MISFGLWIAGLLGRSVTTEQAKRLGFWVALPLVLIAAALLIWGGIKLHDRGVVEVYQDRRDAAVANATLEADREAGQNAAARADAAEALNANLSDALENATRADPQQGTTRVGPVTESYYDQLRKEKR